MIECASLYIDLYKAIKPFIAEYKDILCVTNNT